MSSHTTLGLILDSGFTAEISEVNPVTVEYSLTSHFDAPVARVCEAWTTADQLIGDDPSRSPHLREKSRPVVGVAEPADVGHRGPVTPDHPHVEPSVVLSATDRRHLERCVELAAEALTAGDQPFGSVLVDGEGVVRREDRNRETTAADPTAHPEFALAQWAARHLTAQQRARATVYTSGEHCPMCSAAHAWVGLGRIVFATSAGQTSEWYEEFGAGASPVRALPIGEIAPDVETAGPCAHLAEPMRDLHRRRLAGRGEG